MNNIKHKRGFTLIELLVVIAIIGILASVVLASVTQARGKAADSAVKANLANSRAVTQLQYDVLGCFANIGTVCSPTVPAAVAGACSAAAANTLFKYQKFIDIITAVSEANGGALNSCNASVGGKKWAMAAVLKTDNAKAWCVDAEGVSRMLVNGGVAYTQVSLNAEIVGAVCGT